MSENIDLSYQTRYFGGSTGGHDVELEFDKKLMVLNRPRLRVDGELADSSRVFYGDKDLRASLPDGTEITVRIHSGMYGELSRPQLRQPDGSWVDLQERQRQE
ncbi:hypothetical protein MF406_08865 [Georgenia sp. TF02-10]|uniref:hypothetical protein n=1 Tax=Georgenia sp. TF02-10 TaxID=2917725 RepID=UPI001FA73A56|nr:hypothetical protein [Georgenia sp. TF02-10]UNX56286.1 hypothetical protein MF406_08865 [Georgenia sp. TF02-10]